MTYSIPRYLVPFDPRRCNHRFTDVLIIGGGLAGLKAANQVATDQHVMVVTKDALQQSNSSYAQGGIAGVLDPDDRYEDHVRDTVMAGGDLCDKDVVEAVVRDGPQKIIQLIEWGTQFDQQSGSLQLGREGGHSRHRVVHALGDATGREVMRAVIEWTRDLPNVEILENTFTLDLVTSSGRCRGAVIIERGQKTIVWARETILCTGGAGQIYRDSTNPTVATADGHAMAYRAGAQLRDMEFMQFHPTVLYIAGSSRSLITEAVRGEGAYLVDCHGHRFMPAIDERAELAPRDIVSRGIVRQMEETEHSCVYLDMSHLDPEYVRGRFPGMTATCDEFGMDLTSDRIPVRPGAHYMIGGVTVDIEGRSSLPGLWAAGEVTSSGLHGANRLASNSLLEGLVFGDRAGSGASAAAAAAREPLQVYPLEERPAHQASDALDQEDIRNSLRSLMWRKVGVRRSAPRLQQALHSIDRWQRYVLPHQFDETRGWELQNMLIVAQLVVDTALERAESRGVHFREDYPDQNNTSWQRHIARVRENEQFATAAHAAPPS